MINLHLTRGNNYEGVYLRLPATPGEVGEAFGWLDEIDTEAPTKIIDIVSNIPNLFRYLCHADIDTEGMLGKFQQIAAKTNGLTKEQSQILTGALDAESINGSDDILSVIDRLDEYAFIPNVTCDKELGGYLVDSGSEKRWIPPYRTKMESQRRKKQFVVSSSSIVRFFVHIVL